MVKVAVITRTKDRPNYLRRAIKSVSSQTCDDYVHVIVNDGGNKRQVEDAVNETEGSAKSKIKVFHRDTPSDAPDTIFNESIDRINSEYVAIHDDDDTWHPEFLEQITKVLDGGAKGVVVRANKVTEKEVDGKIVQTKKEKYLPDVKAISLYRQCVDNQLTPIAFMYSRDAYEKVGKYDSSLPVIGDWEFGIRFLQKYDVEFLDPGFALANYHHRKHKAGSSGNSTFGGNDDRHRYYSNKLMNKYLRQELSDGRLGPGYIMSQVRYEQSYIARILGRITPQFLVSKLKKRVQS